MCHALQALSIVICFVAIIRRPARGRVIRLIDHTVTEVSAPEATKRRKWKYLYRRRCEVFNQGVVPLPAYFQLDAIILRACRAQCARDYTSPQVPESGARDLESPQRRDIRHRLGPSSPSVVARQGLRAKDQEVLHQAIQSDLRTLGCLLLLAIGGQVSTCRIT
ncbi:unnamed protein product [Peniophora sp. CBMAI 1063]|nr:unnamed protein product [Peniophora sp. CBMAI 1063]